MAETKPNFTPGPWRVSLYVRNAIRVYGGPRDSVVCEISTGVYENNLANAANAHLIAAAPDLYAALDRVADTIHWMDSDDRDSIVPDGLHEAIRAALRRARGEG